MAEFEPAFAFMLPHEGGESNNPKDSGGFTRFGIAQNKHPEIDVKNITIEDAKDFYNKHFWLPIYGKIVAQVVANKIFDLAVNMGPKQAHVIVQRACRSNSFWIEVDGKFGPKTLGAVNGTFYADLLPKIRIEAAQFYHTLVANNPDQEVFLHGWLNRAKA